MKVLIIKGNKHQSLVHKVFTSKVKRDFDVDVVSEDFDSVELEDIHTVFITAGKLSNTVRKIIKLVLTRDINVYYVNTDLTINNIYLKKFMFLYLIGIDTYNYLLSLLLPIKTHKNDLKF